MHLACNQRCVVFQHEGIVKHRTCDNELLRIRGINQGLQSYDRSCTINCRATGIGNDDHPISCYGEVDEAVIPAQSTVDPTVEVTCGSEDEGVLVEISSDQVLDRKECGEHIARCDVRERAEIGARDLIQDVRIRACQRVAASTTIYCHDLDTGESD